MFWTVPISPDAIHVNLGAGTASLQVTNQHVRDFFNIPNAINNGASDSATVSYAINWFNVKGRRQVDNSDLHVSGLFLDTDARITWSGTDNATGFSFTTDAAGQTVISAQIGHESNGSFFS